MDTKHLYLYLYDRRLVQEQLTKSADPLVNITQESFVALRLQHAEGNYQMQIEIWARFSPCKCGGRLNTNVESLELMWASRANVSLSATQKQTKRDGMILGETR
jgi:hypothetical protein